MSTSTTASTPAVLRGANPLASKVSSVLSASYADSDFREALALVDRRGVQNTAEVRRQLRLDLQKEVIDSNGDIIDEFGKVAEQLRRIGRTIAKLNASFGGVVSEIGAARTSTEPVLAESTRLMTQLRQVETKQELLAAFTATYVLSEQDIALLTLSSEPVDDRFFSVLARAKKMTKDCELLLGFETQTMGLDIMEQTSKNVNLGFQKLYRWIHREFKTLNLENPQLGTSIRRALGVLAERPTMFQNCLDLFAEAREHVLSDSFYTALTGSSAQGGEDPSVKPIELAAHDPLRYVGDMLAWTHSAAVGEREALEVLFVSDAEEITKGLQAGRENEPWRRATDEGDGDDADMSPFNGATALNELVDRDMAGAARVLRQRVEQVIQTNEETVPAYKLANLLNFYKTTFAKLLTPTSALVETLQKLEAEALRQFRALMRDHIAALQPAFDQSLAELGLGPPEFLQDALEQLSAITKSYDTSLTAAVDREADFQPILAEALDPFTASCDKMAATVEGAARAIFSINCLLATRACLARYDFTQRRAAELGARISEEAARLAESQYRFFRAESGLDALMDALARLRESEEDAAKVRALGPVQGPALAQASQTLDDFLPSALMDATERVQDLQDSKLVRDVTEEAAERFCVDFEHVEEMLTMADELAEREEEEGEVEGKSRQAQEQPLRALFPRTTGEIRVLLS